jgi:hypothetical protein
MALTVLLLCSLAAYGQAFGPLVINPIGDTNIMPGTNLSITVSVTNTSGIAANQLSWTLPSAPTGATITNSSPANTALFTWQPTSAQAPSTNTIIVQVQDLANTTNVTSTSFRVNVFTNAVPTPPFLAPVNDSTIVAGQLFTFTNSAHTTDGTTNPLVWSLEDGAPDGASITPDTGVFTWTPTTQQIDVFPIGVTVTENATQLSTTEFFNLTVILTNNCAGFDDFVAAVEQGGVVPLPDCPIIVLSNTLVIANDVTLDAGDAGTVITGNNLTRLFTVLAPATLTLNGLTLSAGRSTNGGAIYVQGGAQAVLSNCIMSGNSAFGSNGVAGANGGNTTGTGGNGGTGTAGGAGFGGAIYSEGDVTISTCQFLTNSAQGGTGGAGGGGGNGRLQGGNGGNGGNGGTVLGGAVYSLGTLSIDSCTFNGNFASAGSGGPGGTNGSGGGPFNGLPGSGGAAGPASGAGVYNAGDAVVMNSTFSSGTATGGSGAAGGTLANNNGSNGPKGGDGSGGGIFGGGMTTVTNCTFYGNSVTGGTGGNGGPANSAFRGGNGGNGGNGLGAGFYGASGTNIVVNCTFALNQANGGTNGVAGSGPFAGTDGSPGAARGAGVSRGAGSFYLQNTILMTNTPGNNVYGSITDGGKNISSDSSLSGTSLKNTDPMLGPLANNGGPTATMALLTTSPAIDAANDAAAPDVDQVGTPRPVGPHSDIGAYEYPTALTPLIVTPPASQTVLVGNSATFTVSAAGATPLAYRWQFNGAPIAGATKTVLTVTNAQPTNAGSYTVSVSNRLAVVSSTATLTVCVPTTISGTVLDGTNGLPGVTVAADANSAVTDETGAYTITGVCSGTYFVFASLAGYQFSPAQPVTIPPAATNVNFTVAQPTYSVSGHVRAGGAGVSGVSIFQGLTTDANGFYALSLTEGSYTLTPFKPGSNYSFQPANRVIVVPPGATNQDFIAGWKITSLVRRADGTIQFQVVGSGSIRVEASSNFINWVTLSNHTAPYLFIDHTASSASQRFYRAAQP